MTWKAPGLENTAIPDLRDASTDFTVMINVACLGQGIDFAELPCFHPPLHVYFDLIDERNHFRRLTSSRVSRFEIKTAYCLAY